MDHKGLSNMDNEEQEELVIPPTFAELSSVQELAKRMADLDKQAREFQAQVEPVIAQAKAEQDEYDKLKRQFEKALAEKWRTVKEVRTQAEEVQRGLQVAKFEKDNLRRELAEELERLQRLQGTLEADQKFDAFLAENGWLWAKSIRDYQKRGLKFMAGAKTEGLHGRANFDQMGLGKTLQAAAMLDVVQQEHHVFCGGQGDDLVCPSWHRSVLWLCPASIKDTTMKEIQKWSPDRPVIMLTGNAGQREQIVKLAHEFGMTLVCNYETLRTTPAVMWDRFVTTRDGVRGIGGEKPIPRQWPIVVSDEASQYKNDGTQLFKFIEHISENAGSFFPMTGTPIENRPEEFWAIMHMLTLKGKHQYMFDDKRRFVMEYCNQWGTETTFAYGAADRLMKKCASMCIRRTKNEVLTELPPKIGGITRFKENPDELVRYVTLQGEQAKLYDQMRERFFVWLDEQHTDSLAAPAVIAQFTRLRQIALYPKGVKIKKLDEDGEVIDEVTLQCEESAKFDECMTLLDELGVAEGNKVVIFTSYEDEVINALKARILAAYPDIEVGRITGKEDSAKKAVVQERFTNPGDNMRVVIGTIRAMGLGLNLQGACSNGIFLDPDWNPGRMEQAEDRVHRMGQKENVQIHTIRAENSIDIYMTKKLLRKVDMASGVVDRQELRQAIEDGEI